MCALTAAGRLAGVTGALFVAEGTVRTDGVDEVEQEPSMMHPATKAQETRQDAARGSARSWRLAESRHMASRSCSQGRPQFTCSSLAGL